MYGCESNIYHTVEVYEQLFKAKQSGHRLQGYYANIHGLLTQLELYQPYTTGLTTQRRYREELVVDIFLPGLDTLISSLIQGSILSKTHLLTLTITFSSTLRVLAGTPVLPSAVSPLTLHHCYLSIPRERGTTKMVLDSVVKGIMASHSLHVSIVDGAIIVLTVSRKILANLIRLPLMPLLMLLPLHPRV